MLALTPPEPLTERTAEARVICALLAAGWSYDLETVRGPLVEAIAGLARWGDDRTASHPLVALAEPVLLQFQGEHERAQDQFDRYARAADPWLRAMGLVYRGAHARELGRLDGAERDIHAALRESRALGEYWGSAIALTELAEHSELRGDHAASIAALEEAVSLGRELNAWGDLTYVEARLAIVRRERVSSPVPAPSLTGSTPSGGARRHGRHRPLGDVDPGRAGLAGGRPRAGRPALHGRAGRDRGPSGGLVGAAPRAAAGPARPGGPFPGRRTALPGPACRRP